MRRPTWTNSKHAAQWSSTLATYEFPKIGSTLVTDITSADIPAVPDPDMDGKTGDCEPGTPAHGDCTGLGRSPRL